MKIETGITSQRLSHYFDNVSKSNASAVHPQYFQFPSLIRKRIDVRYKERGEGKLPPLFFPPPSNPLQTVHLGGKAGGSARFKNSNKHGTVSENHDGAE